MDKPSPAPPVSQLRDEEELRKVFAELDRDGNGHIDEKELHTYLLSFGLPASREDVEQWMSIVDRDHDGNVTFEEFEAFLRSREEFLYETFNKLDLDGDGRLTERELRIGMQQLGMSVTNSQVSGRRSVVSLEGKKGEMDAGESSTSLAAWKRFFRSNPWCPQGNLGSAC